MKACSCKGIRTCAICNPEKLKCENNNCITLYFCPKISTIVKEQCHPHMLCTDNHNVIGNFDGITIVENFLNDNDKICLLNGINSHDWIQSQSGRRKQDFGPKVNFKKQKVNMTKFQGLPHYIEPFVNKFVEMDELTSFRPVELCNLEYDPSKGASIDPHFDDFWLWGERLVTINVQASTYLTFTPGTRDALSLFAELSSVPVCSNGHANLADCRIELKVPMAEGSLVVVRGDARHRWMHAIGTGDIHSTRVAITLRELSDRFVEAHPELSGQLVALAASYNGQPVN